MARSLKLLGLGAAFALASGAAQAENLDAGKSAPALFAATCATCHSSPRGLAKDRGSGGLASYLQEHYTSSPQSAAALAAYLIANPETRAGSRRRLCATQPVPKKGPPSRAKQNRNGKPARRTLRQCDRTR